MKTHKFVPGDRVAYAASFLRNAGIHTGNVPQRRGTFLGYFKGAEKTHGRVRWDDIESVIAAGEHQYADADYVADIRENGSLVGLSAIAKVGSARFGDPSVS